MIRGCEENEYKRGLLSYQDEGKMQKDDKHHSKHHEAKQTAEMSQMGECDVNGHYVHCCIPHSLL